MISTLPSCPAYDNFLSYSIYLRWIQCLITKKIIVNQVFRDMNRWIENIASSKRWAISTKSVCDLLNCLLLLRPATWRNLHILCGKMIYNQFISVKIIDYKECFHSHRQRLPSRLKVLELDFIACCLRHPFLQNADESEIYSWHGNLSAIVFMHRIIFYSKLTLCHTLNVAARENADYLKNWWVFTCWKHSKLVIANFICLLYFHSPQTTFSGQYVALNTQPCGPLTEFQNYLLLLTFKK